MTMRYYNSRWDEQKNKQESSFVEQVNEIYKENKDPELMDLMKRLTAKKQKIDKTLDFVGHDFRIWDY